MVLTAKKGQKLLLGRTATHGHAMKRREGREECLERVLNIAAWPQPRQEIVSIDEAFATYECKLLAADFDGEKVFCKAQGPKQCAGFRLSALCQQAENLKAAGACGPPDLQGVAPECSCPCKLRQKIPTSAWPSASERKRMRA